MTDQPSLFDAPVRPPWENRAGAYHHRAVDTEISAAAAVAPRSGTGRWKVLQAIAAAGHLGRTDHELSVQTGLRLYTAAPRRNELLRDGWIKDSGERRPTDSGSLAVVWVLTPEGRDWLTLMEPPRETARAGGL